MPVYKRPLKMEIDAIQSAIDGKMSRLVAKVHGRSIDECI